MNFFKKNNYNYSYASLIIIYLYIVFTYISNVNIYNLLRDFSVDDSFYYFNIAYNMANLHMSSFDGITTTNGYHPLWLYVLTVIYLFPLDKIEVLFVIKIVEISFSFLSIYFLLKALKNFNVSYFFSFPMIFFLMLSDHYFLGLESSISLLLLSYLIYLISIYNAKIQFFKINWIIFITSFLLPWARLELIMIPIAIASFLWISSRRKVSYYLFSGATLGIVVYVVMNFSLFDTFFPISGLTKSHILSEKLIGWNIGVTQFVSNFYLIATSRKYSMPLIISIGVILYTLVFLLNQKSIFKNKYLEMYLGILFALSLCTLARASYYALTVHPKFAMHSWYFTNSDVLLWLIPAFVFLIFKEKFGRGIKIVVPLSLILIIYFFTYMSLVVNPVLLKYSSQLYTDWEIASYDVAQILNQSIDKDSVILSKDSGVLGYFSNAPVINIDGLVNSKEYFDSRMSSTGIKFLSQYKPSFFINLLDTNTQQINNVLCRTVNGNTSSCTKDIYINNIPIINFININYGGKSYKYNIYSIENSIKKFNFTLPKLTNTISAKIFGNLIIIDLTALTEDSLIRLNYYPQNTKILARENLDRGYWSNNFHIQRGEKYLIKALPTIKMKQIDIHYIRNQKVVSTATFRDPL